MPLLTVRLTDGEHAALKKLAAGSSMAELIRGWISAGLRPITPAWPRGEAPRPVKFTPAPKPGKKVR